ncbi:MAG: hypothetical protein J0M18_12175 [Ignavibacteria bacterium]|jgi:hypothetical protein|nr:hypothetical protein [Ignavibacteria bacterium]
MDDTQVQSELSYIKSVMEKSRPSIVINGWHFIMWGILTFFGLLNTYLAILSGAGAQIYFAWMIIVAFGWICSFGITWYQRKKGMIRAAKAIDENLIHRISTSCGIAMIILGFVGPLSGVFSPYAIGPSMSAVLGVMYFMIGSIVKNKMVTNLGYAWWIGSAGLFAMTIDKSLRPESLLVYAILIVCLQVIPGFILNKKFKTVNQSA